MTDTIDLPDRIEDLLGAKVPRPAWGPAVRWHPVHDVPRVPRKLPAARTGGSGQQVEGREGEPRRVSHPPELPRRGPGAGRT